MKIFISYSRTDDGVVRRVCELLKASGHDPWLDTAQIRGGSRWRKEIADAITVADIFLLVLSSRAVGSAEVQRELDLAGDLSLRILPVVVERSTSLPAEMRLLLAGVHWINFADDFDAGGRQLMLALGSAGRVGPPNYVWGMDKADIDVKLLQGILTDKNTSTNDRIIEFIKYTARLRVKAQEKINERLHVLARKEREFLEGQRRMADRCRTVKQELDEIKRVSPASEACRLLQSEYLIALREERAFLQGHQALKAESDELFRDMTELRNSEKAASEFSDNLARIQAETLRKLTLPQ